jgi:TonB-linked SusC/RagA family outer membrane protein
MFRKRQKRKLGFILRLNLMLMFVFAFALQAEQIERVNKNRLFQDEPITITGKVTDNTGAPLPGVNVYNKADNMQGTITDFDGNYTLQIDDANATLVFSFMGFEMQEVPVEGNTKIDIVLQEETTQLQDVVVVGYGVQKKENVTGSVATVETEKMEQRSVQSVAGAIAGTMPGVTSIQSSGEPGSQRGNITIRGKNSIAGGSPMVIVDGVPGSISNLDMNDVESISVLKDAASAAIYGVTAANGVILVTTKKGKKGSKPVFSYRSYYSWASPTVIPQYLGSYDHARLYNEAYLNDNPGQTPPFSEQDLELFKNGTEPFTHPNTDWYKEVLKKSAFEQKQHFQVNGGSEHVVYNASFGYIGQDALIEGLNYKRYNVRVNLQADIKKWLTTGINLFGMDELKNDNYTYASGIFDYINRTPPIYPIYNPDGSYNYQNPYTNPLACIDGDGFRNSNWKEGNVIINVELKPFKDFSVKGVYQANIKTTNKKSYRKELRYSNEDGTSWYPTQPNYLEDYNNDSKKYVYQLLMNYDLNIKDLHRMHFLLGFEQSEDDNNWFKAWRNNFPTDLIYTLNNGDPNQQFNDGSGSTSSRRSFFGRYTYDFKSKYLFEVNMRYDGISWMPPETRWGFFPAVSAAWRISEEGFMSNADNVDNIKLRFGYGSTGNNEMGGDNFSYLETYGISQSYAFGDEVALGAWEARYPNKDINWATINSKEVGLECSFWKGLLGFDITYYHKKTKNMILSLPVPSIVGINPPKQNKGSLKNTGFDFMLTHRNSIGEFAYDFNFNLSYVKNEITDMAGADQDDGNFWYGVGYPIGSYFGYKTVGFFNTQEEIDKWPEQVPRPKTLGGLKYADTNGDGVVDSEDRVVIGQNFPSYSLGFGFSGHYKSFDLDILFQGVYNINSYWEFEAAYAFFNGGKALPRHLDRWTPDHHDASYPKLTLVDNDYERSDFWLQNTSYLRMKSLTLSYNIPGKTLEKIKLKEMRVYFSGENLLTFTKVDDFDPETVDFFRGWNYNNVKKITLGLNISF